MQAPIFVVLLIFIKTRAVSLDKSTENRYHERQKYVESRLLQFMSIYFKERKSLMTESRFEQFTLTLAAILKSIKKIKDHRMSQFGLRSSHVMLLYQLGNHPEGLTPVDLAESGSIDKALVSRTISDLQEKGLVHTLQSTKKYKVRLCLTPSGEEIAEYIAITVNKMQEQISGNIPEADLEVFYRTLFTLRDNIDALVRENNE